MTPLGPDSGALGPYGEKKKIIMKKIKMIIKKINQVRNLIGRNSQNPKSNLNYRIY